MGVGLDEDPKVAPTKGGERLYSVIGTPQLPFPDGTVYPTLTR